MGEHAKAHLNEVNQKSNLISNNKKWERKAKIAKTISCTPFAILMVVTIF